MPSDNKPTSSSTTRFLQLSCPSCSSYLLIRSLRGTEAVSQLYSYTLDILCDPTQAVDFKDVLGQPATITVLPVSGADSGTATRYIHGYFSNFTQGLPSGYYMTYTANLVPWPWFLSINRHAYFMEDVTAHQVITNVIQRNQFTDVQIELNDDEYPTMEYCVQYEESDFTFLSRLMERYGIFYYFKHTKDSHTWVITDDSKAIPNERHIQRPLLVTGPNQVYEANASVTNWSQTGSVQPSEVKLDDYNFQTPNSSLAANSTINGNNGSHKQTIYQNPGFYPYEEANTGASGGSAVDGPQQATGQKLATWWMQSIAAKGLTYSATSYNQELVPACVFTTSDAADSPKYLVLQTQITANVPDPQTGGGDTGGTYIVQLTCMDAATTYRPPQVTPRPKIYGPQTAKVYGATGSDYDMDKYGRIKVQFRWDPDANADQSGSGLTPKGTMYLRVAQMWAGQDHGSIFNPHVGDEVIVSFLDGDPDRPIITGSVYNGSNMPPVSMPDNQTQSVVKDGAKNTLTMESKDDADNDAPYFSITQPTTEASGSNANTLTMTQQGANQGVKITDYYGNMVHLDSVGKKIDIFTPNKNTKITLDDKGVTTTTDADTTNTTSGDSKETVLGKLWKQISGTWEEATLGIKSSTVVGFYQSTNLGAKNEITTPYKKTYILGIGESKTIMGPLSTNAKSEFIMGNEQKMRTGNETKVSGKGDWKYILAGAIKNNAARIQEVAAAQKTVTAGKESVTAAEKQISAAEEAIKVAKAQYKAGTLSQTAAQYKIDVASAKRISAREEIEATQTSIKGAQATITAANIKVG